MTKKKAKKTKLHRIAIDLKDDEYQRLKELADVDLLPVKGEGRQCLLIGMGVRSDNRGEQVYPSESAKKQIAEMPF